MPHKLLKATAMAFLIFTGAALAQPAQPPFATRKIDGTDNVYLFRYQGHQSMFIVTPKGVIATDPIGRYRPQAVTAYLDEIKKAPDQPVKYLTYSTRTSITLPAASPSRIKAQSSSPTKMPRHISN